MGEERVYTVEEANAVLPDLRGRLERIRVSRRVVLKAGERIREAVAVDGGGQAGKDYWEALAALRRDVTFLAEQDILLRDPEIGLIDFPGEVDGQPAFLCWRLGEERVSHWHPPDAGFAGRRPL